MSIILSAEQKDELKSLHKQECYRRHADRIKVILLLDLGLTYGDIARYLLLDDQTIRNYEKRYLSSGVTGLLSDNYVGCVSKLTSEQEEQLKEHLRKNTYSTAKEIVEYVKQVYTPEGMVHVLNRLHFTYKKTTAVPSKADPVKQKEFIKKYEQLKAQKAEEDKILFMDGTHPQHNSMPAYCWIEKGEKKEIPSNAGRKRINLNGVIDAETHEVTIREDDSVNAQSTIKLFEAIEAKYDKAQTIYISVCLILKGITHTL